MADTVGRDKATATKSVSLLTYRISVVNSAMKARCLVFRKDKRFGVELITYVKGL